MTEVGCEVCGFPEFRVWEIVVPLWGFQFWFWLSGFGFLDFELGKYLCFEEGWIIMGVTNLG